MRFRIAVPVAIWCSLLFAAGSAQAATYTFNATADARVESTSPTTNYAAFNIKASNTGLSSYVKFDAAIPSNETITAATLKLSPEPTLASLAGFDTAAVADSSWAESTLNYNNRPAMGAAGGSTGSWAVGAAADSAQATVTSIVPAAGGVVTIGLKSTNYAEALSREDGTTVTPHLVVTTATVPGVNETFATGYNGYFVHDSWFWNDADMGYAKNPRWFAETGQMSLDTGRGRVNYDGGFRMWTRTEEVGTFGNVKVSADYYFDNWTASHGGVGYHGGKFWLRRKLCTNEASCSKIDDNGDGNQLGYTAEFQLASNTIIVQKRDKYGCASQSEPGYYILGSTSYTFPQDTWKNVAGAVFNNANGSVTIKVFIDGVLKLTATDSGACGSSPITASGRVGVRTDYVNSLFDNLKIESWAG